MFRFLWLTLCMLGFSSVNATNPKLCIHCKHFTKLNFITDNEFGHCKKFPKYPKYDENYVDYLVTGKTKDNVEDYHYCSTMRMDANKCGFLGISYESKK